MQQGEALIQFKKVFTDWYYKQKDAGKTRQDVCELLEVRSSTIDKWLNSTDNRAPSCENLLKVANAIGCTVDYLIREGAPETRDPDISNAAVCTGLSESAVKRLRQVKTDFPSEAAVIDTLLSSEFELSAEENGSGSGIARQGVLSAIADYLDNVSNMRNELLTKGTIETDRLQFEQFKLTKAISGIIGQDFEKILDSGILLEYIKIRHPARLTNGESVGYDPGPAGDDNNLIGKDGDNP